MKNGTMAMTIVILGWAIAARACPFYQLVPTRVNYTTFKAAYEGATIDSEVVTFGIPVRVCDGAQIGEDEETVVITNPVEVIGDISETTGRAKWTVENPTLNPIIAVLADSAIFRDIQFIFETTMFTVEGAGYLYIDHVRFWFGEVAIRVDTNGNPGTGTEIDHGVFFSVGRAVQMLSTEVICIDCRMINILDGAFVATDAVLIRSIISTDNTFTDVAKPFAIQGDPGGPITQAELSQAYIDKTDLINCRTYPDSTVTFGASSGTSSKNCRNVGFNLRDILFLVFFGLGLLLVYVVVIITFSKNNTVYENIIYRVS